MKRKSQSVSMITRPVRRSSLHVGYRTRGAAECRSFHQRLADLQEVSPGAHNVGSGGSPTGSGKMIRAILFDFERTLVDIVTTPDAAQLFRDGASHCYAFLSAHELPLPTFDAFRRQQKWIHCKIEW